MLEFFGRRRTQDRVLGFHALSCGVWISLAVLAMLVTIGARSAEPPRALDDTIQAGPLDDTIDYMECLLRRLQNLPCEGDPDPAEPEPDPEPVEPIE